MAEDYKKELGSEPVEFLRRDFYVDDGLKSVATARDAKKLISKTKEMCHCGGFNLHKFTSNKREVIEAIPTEDRAKGIKELNLERDELAKGAGHQMVYRVRLLQVPYCSAGSPFDSARNPFHSQHHL